MSKDWFVQFTKVKYPCTKDCPDRQMRCHSTCEAYLKAHCERQQELEEQNKIRQQKQDVYAIGREMHDKWEKRQRRISL